MTLFSFIPLRWGWPPFAKWKDLRPTPPQPYISEKIARDIGIDPDDPALNGYKWPSQDTDRCRF